MVLIDGGAERPSDAVRSIGIGVVGCGSIACTAHLPAYARLGLRVVGCYDVDRDAAERARRTFAIPRVFSRASDLFADPEIAVVDIATFPDVRPLLIQQAIAAGKHVLAQKPLALTVAAARALVDEADRGNVKLAVNLNGRWAPAWTIATDLIAAGAIGAVRAVTHVEDDSHTWLEGSRFDTLDHAIIADFLVHWVDISHCWIGAATQCVVRAREYRTRSQPPSSRSPWGATIDLQYADGASVVIRAIGCAASRRGVPFWIHGDGGTISGRVRFDDFVEIERGGSVERHSGLGDWFTVGFGGAMCELLSAVVDGRAPAHSARSHLPALELIAAACESADLEGAARVVSWPDPSTTT